MGLILLNLKQTYVDILYVIEFKISFLFEIYISYF